MLSATQGKINWKFILSLFVFIAIIGSVIFWFLTRQQISSDWKTYTNENGSYSFQYPKEWNAITNKYNSKNALFGPGATSESGYGGVEYMGTLLSGQSLQDFIKEFNKRIEAGSTSETTAIINGQSVVVSILQKASIEPTQVKSVSFEMGGEVFGMYLMYKTNFDQYPEDKQRLTLFDRMLNTFTLLSTKSSIAQVTYICNNNKTIEASFYKGEVKPVKPGEPPIPTGSVNLVLSDGRNFNLPQTISASGVRYANNDESFVFWSKGNGALILENNIEKNYIGCILISKDPGGLSKTYLDSENGFSLRYPENYSINSSYQYQGLGSDKTISGVKFIIPADMTKGTNLSNFDTGISIETIPNVKNCSADLFVYPKTEAKAIVDNNVEYSMTEVSDAGAGNFYEEKVWAIVGTNPCVAIRYFIHSTNIGNYPENTVKEFNKQELINQFDKIRNSLVFN